MQRHEFEHVEQLSAVASSLRLTGAVLEECVQHEGHILSWQIFHAHQSTETVYDSWHHIVMITQTICIEFGKKFQLFCIQDISWEICQNCRQ